MSSNRFFSLDRRRCLQALGSATAALASPSFSFAVVTSAETGRKYSKRVIGLVEQSLVIDMLGPLKLDFRPEAFAEPLSEAEAAMFRSCGITAFHNSVGIGGPTAYDDALQFIAAWSGFAGRNSD